MFSESMAWGFPGWAPTALRDTNQTHPPPLELSVTEEERKK